VNVTTKVIRELIRETMSLPPEMEDMLVECITEDLEERSWKNQLN